MDTTRRRDTPPSPGQIVLLVALVAVVLAACAASLAFPT
jgi:hypothetical protein